MRTPKLYHFNGDTNSQIQECLPGAVNLKNYCLKHYVSPTPVEQRPECRELGRAVGAWLRSFHDWARARPELRDEVRENRVMQNLKYLINYPTLVATVDRFPDVLGPYRAVFGEIDAMAKAEMEAEKLQVIHGDFWTGKYVVVRRAPLMQYR